MPARSMASLGSPFLLEVRAYVEKMEQGFISSVTWAAWGLGSPIGEMFGHDEEVVSPQFK